MAGMNVSVTVHGSKEEVDRLTRLGVDLLDWQTEMTEIGILLTHYYENEGFVSHGSVYGLPWQSLAPSTQADKSVNWAGRPDLVRTGDMQQGFESHPAISNVTIDNKMDYFEYQQDGTGRGIPPRVMMSINETLVAMITGVIKAGIETKIAGGL